MQCFAWYRHKSLTGEHNSCVCMNVCVHNLLQLLENISAHNTCHMLLHKNTKVIKKYVHTNLHTCMQYGNGKSTCLLHVWSVQVMQCSVAAWSWSLDGLRVQFASAAWGEKLMLFNEFTFAIRVRSIALLLFIVMTGWSHGVHDAVCVNTLRVRCECFLRVVVRV